MAASRASEHHCGPFGPNCTAKVGLSTASAIASTRAICSSTLGGGCRNVASTVARAASGSAAMSAAWIAVDERIAVAHEDGEGHAHADVARRPGDFARLLDRRHRPVEAGVVRHDRAGAAARRSAESGERAEIGVDRRHRREPQQPGLERLCRRRRTRSATTGGNGRGRWRAPAGRGGAAAGVSAAGAIAAIAPSSMTRSTGGPAGWPSVGSSVTPEIVMLMPARRSR